MVQVGDFISIPSWQTFGMVHEVRPSIMGSDDSITVLVQEHPDQPVRNWRYYRLEPGEYEVEA